MTRTALRTTFLSLRVRNFRLFFTGQLISQVGTWLTSIALVLLVLHRTGSGIAIGLLTAAQFGPILILGAWAGLVADRSNKRTLLLVTQSLEMVQSFALAALAFWPGAPLWSFYAVAFAGGIMMAFDNPTRRAFVSEMVPEANVQNAVSLNAALMTSSRIIGPALAGLLSVTVGFGWCFTVDGLSYLAVLASLWMMRTAELRTPPVADRARGQVREGFRYVRRTPDLWIPLVMLAVIGTFTFNFAVVLPLLIERSLGGTDGTYTAIYSVLSVGSLLGALAAAQRRQVQIRTMCTAAAVFGVAMLLFASTPGVSFAYPLALLVGFASVWFVTASTAMMQLRSERRMRGRVLALQAIVLIGSTPVGGPLLGYVSDLYGARAGIVLGGLAAIGAAVWGTTAARRVHRTTSTPESASPEASAFPTVRQDAGV
ncbi:MAG: MFS transporter [Actinomycetota bacterium]|jgi:MFS family permease